MPLAKQVVRRLLESNRKSDPSEWSSQTKNWGWIQQICYPWKIREKFQVSNTFSNIYNKVFWKLNLLSTVETDVNICTGKVIMKDIITKVRPRWCCSSVLLQISAFFTAGAYVASSHCSTGAAVWEQVHYIVVDEILLYDKIILRLQLIIVDDCKTLARAGCSK